MECYNHDHDHHHHQCLFFYLQMKRLLKAIIWRLQRKKIHIVKYLEIEHWQSYVLKVVGDHQVVLKFTYQARWVGFQISCLLGSWRCDTPKLDEKYSNVDFSRTLRKIPSEMEDGGNPALHCTAYTVDAVDTFFAVDTVYTVYTVYEW